jgi:type IV secretion system protein VirB11
MPNISPQDEQLLDSVKERAKLKIERDLGPDILAALADPKTVEIINADGKLWQERLGEKMFQIGTVSSSRAESIIKTIAGYHGKEITKGRPLLECELPLDGSRFAGQFPPIVSAPTFAIRKKAVAIFTLDQYVSDLSLTKDQHAVILDAVKNPSKHLGDRQYRIWQNHIGQRHHQRDGSLRSNRANFHHRRYG